jgi:DNA repair photolyase
MKKFDDKRKGTGVQEWAEHSFNLQIGCQNNCIYCYAANNSNRYGIRKRDDWSREELTKNASIQSYPLKQGVVMFPTTHDITDFNVEQFIRIASLVLAKGNRLLIVSKPQRIVIWHVMRSLEQWKSQILFRFTIGAMDDCLVNLWEPGASHPLDRLFTLADTQLLGFARSVSIEPMLGGVEETLRVVDNVRIWNPETVWIGKMNKIRLRVQNIKPEVNEAINLIEYQQRDSEILRLYAALKDVPVIRWKDSINTVLAENGIETA